MNVKNYQLTTGNVMTLIRKLTLLLLLNFMSYPLFAETRGIDAVLVLDSSGSMKHTDPDRLRVPAAKLFLSLLHEEDRAGVISFSDEAYPVVHIQSAYGKHNQEILFNGVDRISAKGGYTNLHAALLAGREMLMKVSEPGRRRILVLMSDGRMDVGDPARDRRFIQDIKGSLGDSLKKDGVEVFSIAFTQQADSELMRAIAEKTEGVFHSAEGVDDLHKVFGSIFENVKQPDMLPMTGGVFVVDSTVQEVTIVASRKRPGHKIVLELPDGKTITAQTIGDMGRWSESPRFDMVTIRMPMVGDWKLLSSSGNDKAYVVTNLGLETNLKSSELALGSEMDLAAWLHKDGVIITEDTLLQGTDFKAEIISPNGESRYLALQDIVMGTDVPDGRYQGLLTLKNEGRYQIRVLAKANTFQREKSFFLNVVKAPENAEVVEPVIEPKAEPVAESKPEAVTEPTPEPVPESTPEPAPEEVEEEEYEEESGGIDIALIAMIFVGVNVVVGAGIGGFMWWRKRKDKKATETDKDADDNEDEEEEINA